MLSAPLNSTVRGEQNKMKRISKKQAKTHVSELDTKMSKAHPMIKQAFSEFKKEIDRLQKQLVKEQISHESEIARMNAEHEEEIKSLPNMVFHVAPSKVNKDIK